MARLTQRLSILQVQSMDRRGWYADGLGLYLQVSAVGTKSWVYRYTRDGKQHWHGLGPVSPLNSLKQARYAADGCRQQLRQGIDPIIEKKNNQRQQRLAEAASMTFDECALRYIDRHQHGWKNSKHHQQWQNSLATYASPGLGSLSVQEITTQDVLNMIEPIWNSKTETANRVRQRIELIIDWATAMGFRDGENPARWRGHIEKLLPKPSKVRPVRHHEALPYTAIPDFFARLEGIQTIAALLLRFTILTATRSSEARLATWNELDLSHCMWIIPPQRMKNSKPHRIPLSQPVVRVLEDLYIGAPQGFVFSKTQRSDAITEAAVRKLLKSVEPGITLHGFRATFRDWCAEKTEFSRELAEKALSHSLQDATEAAYQRGDMIEKRNELMTKWADFCYSEDQR